MKNKLCVLVLGTMLLSACATSQQRSKEQMDSIKTNNSDTTRMDTLKRDTSSNSGQRPMKSSKM